MQRQYFQDRLAIESCESLDKRFNVCLRYNRLLLSRVIGAIERVNSFRHLFEIAIMFCFTPLTSISFRFNPIQSNPIHCTSPHLIDPQTLPGDHSLSLRQFCFLTYRSNNINKSNVAFDLLSLFLFLFLVSKSKLFPSATAATTLTIPILTTRKTTHNKSERMYFLLRFNVKMEKFVSYRIQRTSSNSGTGQPLQTLISILRAAVAATCKSIR